MSSPQGGHPHPQGPTNPTNPTLAIASRGPIRGQRVMIGSTAIKPIEATAAEFVLAFALGFLSCAFVFVLTRSLGWWH